MKIHHLRDVLAVAEQGSLRAASRHLGVAQPALTRSIRELERELGAVLFVRSASGVVVTAVGERFIRRANAAHSELLRARDEVGQLQGQATGRLSVCLSTVAHIALLPEALGAFRKRYPGIHLDLFEGVFPTYERALRDGTLDCYIGPPPGAPAAAGLVVEKLFDNTRVIIGRKGHPLARARSLSELVDAEWITTSITRKAEEELGPLFAQNGLPAPKLVMQSHTALTFIIAITSSDLLMMLPVQWLTSPLTRDALRTIPVVESLPSPPMCVVRRAGLPLTPAAEYFCDMIRRAAERAVGAILPKARTVAAVKKSKTPA